MALVMSSHGTNSSPTEAWSPWSANNVEETHSQSQLLGGVQPAWRGSRTRLCSGVLQETHGQFGWILPDQKINHPASSKHRGLVWLDTSDIRPGSALRKGSAVEFYLYVDAHGLGAEDCSSKGAKSALRGQGRVRQSAGRPSPGLVPKPPVTHGPSDSSDDSESTHSGTGGSWSGSSTPVAAAHQQAEVTVAAVAAVAAADAAAAPPGGALREPRRGTDWDGFPIVEGDFDLDGTTMGSRSSQSTPEVMLVEPNYARPSPGGSDDADPVASLLAELRAARERAARLARRLDAHVS